MKISRATINKLDDMIHRYQHMKNTGEWDRDVAEVRASLAKAIDKSHDMGPPIKPAAQKPDQINVRNRSVYMENGMAYVDQDIISKGGGLPVTGSIVTIGDVTGVVVHCQSHKINADVWSSQIKMAIPDGDPSSWTVTKTDPALDKLAVSPIGVLSPANIGRKKQHDGKCNHEGINFCRRCGAKMDTPTQYLLERAHKIAAAEIRETKIKMMVNCVQIIALLTIWILFMYWWTTR